MDTRTASHQNSGLKPRARLQGPGIRWQLALVAAVVLLLRLPFLNQAVQGDDVYFLAGAEHAQIEPLHPNHTSYMFLGEVVDMRGHPHPPFDSWFLGLLLAAIGDIRELPFHAAYILFSLIAAVSMLSLAQRFSPQPLWATLLFLAVPAFVINGNSFESDVPFLAFWMAAVALFASGRWVWSAIALILASMTAFQAVFLTPILWLYVWLYCRRSRPAWMVTLVPPVTIAVWQFCERLSSGVLPASVLSGYMDRYGWQVLQIKLHNSVMLAIHSLWIVFPLLLPLAILASWKRRDRDTLILVAWIAIFFAGALVVFFAGSARYLLPIAAPVCLLVSRIRPKWLALGFACQLALSLSLAVVNYQHWDGYRRFAESLKANGRVWINGEWFRYYLEAAGGLPIKRGQAVRAGDIVVSSELAYPVQFTHGGGALTRIAEMEIRPSIPLRLIALDAKSAYSAATGFRPFDVSSGPIDRLHADLVVDRLPTLSILPMNAPEASAQIVSGIYELEGVRWRWMGERAAILLKTPPQPQALELSFTIPDAAPARRVTMLLEGREVAANTYPGPGSYILKSSPQALNTPTSTITITVDKAFSAPGDARRLGVILTEVGFAK